MLNADLYISWTHKSPYSISQISPCSVEGETKKLKSYSMFAISKHPLSDLPFIFKNTFHSFTLSFILETAIIPPPASMFYNDSSLCHPFSFFTDVSPPSTPRCFIPLNTAPPFTMCCNFYFDKFINIRARTSAHCLSESGLVDFCTC